MTQAEALEILKTGASAFITGAAGSGKTHLLRDYIKYLDDHNVAAGVTASTGIAATHMGGTTIHAWTGLGIRDALTNYDIEDLTARSYLQKRIGKARVLIIDEVSMLHHFRLDLVNKLVQAFKRNNLPFGGMQVIFCGDFFQLPPVARVGEDIPLFAYHSESWRKLDPKICYLEEQHRQSDKIYLEILNAIRSGSASASENIVDHLKNRFNKKPEVAARPTKLYSHNANVDIENEKELNKLQGKTFEYFMESRGRENLSGILKKSCLAPEILRLKIGAHVMFVKNNFEEGYVNGTLGQVVNCGGWGMTVRTSRGKFVKVAPASWRIEEDGKIKAEIFQYPLRLAWAITVHKSQGMSLDAAEIDLSQSFEKGMGYVALSRVRSLSGLSLLGLNDMALKVSEEVLEMDEIFQEKSAALASEISAMGKAKLAAMQKEFLAKNSGGKSGKKEKISTVEITKRFLAEKKSLKEIAKARNLSVDTIMNHAEKIKEKESDFDFSFLGEGISATKTAKIRSALVKNGMENGQYLLTPAKNILGENATFDEIRIVRLLMK